MTVEAVALTVAASTNVGQRRSLNEDAVLARRPVFIVADGMGGHDAGDRASAIAVAEMGRLGDSPSVADVRDALTRARWHIDRLAASDARHAAGTTVSGVVLVEQDGLAYWLVLNVGDSRTYHVRGDAVSQVSVDHSEAQEMIEAGRLAPGAANQYARRHVITRVLGAHTAEAPDYWLLPVQAGERWMVCSDGLTGELDDQEIAAILTTESADDAVRTLVNRALGAGGRDNISVVVVDVAPHCPDEDLEHTIEDNLVLMGPQGGTA
ncbi:MAG: protein phosphatase 2C domain-containing protein [Propionibacteriaceae bacterium]|nr:protein phosphatase 2C domain-containing protein [Propionibacteriaceae bacterium]